MKKKVLLIAAAAVLLVGGGAAWYFLMGPGAAVQAAAVPPEPPPPGLLELDEFLANLNEPGGDHYAKVKVTLAIRPPESIEEMNGNPLMLARLRDRILTLLTSKTFSQLTDPEGKEQFRREIMGATQELITGAELTEVLFSDFIVQ